MRGKVRDRRWGGKRKREKKIVVILGYVSIVLMVCFTFYVLKFCVILYMNILFIISRDGKNIDERMSSL